MGIAGGLQSGMMGAVGESTKGAAEAVARGLDPNQVKGIMVNKAIAGGLKGAAKGVAGGVGVGLLARWLWLQKQKQYEAEMKKGLL